jgi:hypothetical protein
MPKHASSHWLLPSRYRRRQAAPPTPIKFYRPPLNLASLLRGLYARVARKLRVDPSYVSRVARGERQSARVEKSLRRELRGILQLLGKVHRTRRRRFKH